MSEVFRKLNLRDAAEILVLHAPASFEPELASLGVPVVRDLRQAERMRFVLVFATTQREVDEAAAHLTTHTTGDLVLWFAYPKQSSRRYRCEFNRDTGWASLTRAGFESVRMVAIDEDWSALRFRRHAFVKARAR